MKLWLKQTLMSLTIILVTVSACLYFFTAVQTNDLLDQAEENGLQSLKAFCEHLGTVNTISGAAHSAEDTVKTALIQYTFSTYARLFQNAAGAYSLADGSGYLYNVSGSDPLALLPLTSKDAAASRWARINGQPLLIQGARIQILNMPITVYLTQDLTQTYDTIARLAQAAQTALGACMILCSTLLPVVICKSLRPLRKLTRITREIADGQYALRARIASRDEVGELSSSFDRMAQTVEQKIESLEETAKRRELLLGALTHEMKTPMTAIIGYAQSLIAMPLTEEKRMDAAAEIYEAALRTERLSQKMMYLIAMADHSEPVKRSCFIPALFRQVQEAMQPALRAKKLDLAMRMEADYLNGDADLFFTLLTNLMDNAVKASRPNTTITLSAQLVSDMVRLQVADQGGGIPADKIPLVTEPFYRVDKARSRKQGGAGLGLSICQVIAKAYGGKLSIDSDLGVGTTVSVDFPKEKEAARHE